MDLRSYLRALRKGWWIILLSAVLGLAGAALVTMRASPQYASSVTWFVSTQTEGGTSPLAADQFATRRITSYVGLLSADRTAKAVLDATGLDLTVGQISSRISGDADLNTVLLTATVVDSSPDRSLQIAQGLASEFGKIVDQVDPIGPDNVVLRVISGPTLNPNPVAPRKTYNLAIGLLAGLALGVVLALMREVLDNTVRQVSNLSELTRVPVLGVIPYEKEARRTPLIDKSRTRSIRAEAFRQLRTNLQFVDVDRPVQVLVLTSSVPHEAKSTTATNLAVTFAESGRKVLLIEADLRRPQVADYLGLERAVGLTSVLTGAVRLDDAVQSWGEQGLFFLASGPIPPNPSELLGSAAMSTMLKSARRSFDVIVIDTPPLLPVTDAAVTAKLADGAVLVVRYGKTKRNQVQSALRSLRSVDARVLGTVFNMVPARGADGYDTYAEGYRGEQPTHGDDSVEPNQDFPGVGTAEADGYGNHSTDSTFGTSPETRSRSSRLSPRRQPD